VLQTISIIVSGKVQGVYYRQSTQKKALQLTITGTVKNLPDGTVSIVATGTSENLAILTDWCKQGPLRAKVVEIQVKPQPLLPFDTFSILRN
jgi:acylphosphatase